MNTLKNNRIIIIEPSPVVRRGMKSLLEENSDFCIINTYPNLQSFQENIKDNTFDIILINPAIINFYNQFNVRTLFSNYKDVILIAILYGYVDSKTIDSFDGTLDIYDEGIKMVKKLRIVVKEFGHNRNTIGSDSVELSEREKEILVSVAKGLINKEIANNHNISVHTVISHRKNITRKTGIKTVSGLTIYAIFNNLISQEDL